MGDRNERFSYNHDAQAGTLQLTGFGSKESFALTTKSLSDGALLLEGPFREGHVRVAARKQPDRSFPLQTRGFNWVQELPYNR
jgi:hypothetical protein